MSHKKNNKKQQKIDKIVSGLSGKKLSVVEALELIRKHEKAKFNESVELAFCLGIDTKQADQQIRGTVILPAGTGKSTRVAVVAQGDFAKDAQKAGADIVGSDELLREIESGKTDFDKLLATPDMMKNLGKLGRILGPKGLMPNPKDGTVTNNIFTAVENIKKGKQLSFRAEKDGGVVHMIIGKVKFSDAELTENLKEAFSTLQKMKPSATKGLYFKSVFIKTTMGPAFELDANLI